MAIPGVGPVVAAGWLVSTLAGAAAGAAAGGVIGATQAGVRAEASQCLIRRCACLCGRDTSAVRWSALVWQMPTLRDCKPLWIGRAFVWLTGRRCTESPVGPASSIDPALYRRTSEKRTRLLHLTRHEKPGSFEPGFFFTRLVKHLHSAMLGGHMYLHALLPVDTDAAPAFG